MSNVPNTNTFSLQDVANVLYGDVASGRNLLSCFADAIAAFFNPTYSGSKNSLLNFRDYGTIGESGFLYNWFAVNTKLLAPDGWHIPSVDDCEELKSYIRTIGSDLKEAGTFLWKPPNTWAREYLGFNARPGGWFSYGGYTTPGYYGNWWSSTAYTRYRLSYNSKFVEKIVDDNPNDLRQALSIRCVRDSNTSWEPDEVVTDIDGNTYGTVLIGGHIWLNKNLNTTKYNDGSSIPFCEYGEWFNYIDRRWGDSLSNTYYGKLYNWAAAAQANIAPIGWHVATSSDWDGLIVCLHQAGHLMKTGYNPVTGENDLNFWDYPNDVATNNLGFSATPSGHCNEYQLFQNAGSALLMWTSNSHHNDIDTNAYTWKITSSGYIIVGATGNLYFNDMKYGLSIRCIKDDTNDTGTVTDIVGNIYPTIKIGNQVWMTKNLKTTHYKNGASIPNIQDNSAWYALTTGARCAYK
jgi:uncharacterized protein (TIGR02145 family)